VDDAGTKESPESDDEALFDSDEEVGDDLQHDRYVIQDLKIRFNSPVIHLSLPNQSEPSPQYSKETQSGTKPGCIVVGIACLDGSSKILLLPLNPPSAAAKRKGRLGIQVCNLEHPSPNCFTPNGMAITLITSPEDASTESRALKRGVSKSEQKLLVSYATSELSGALHLYQLSIEHVGSKRSVMPKSMTPWRSMYLEAVSTSLSFSSDHSMAYPQLLMSNIVGSAYIYQVDPDSSITDVLRPSHTFTSPFMSDSEALPRKKSILAASWLSSGSSILLLLEDGQFRVFDLFISKSLQSISQTQRLSSLVREGYLADTPEMTTNSTIPPITNSKRNHLMPMTPNTRRTKSENLFSGPSNDARHSVPTGGIALAAFEASSNNNNNDRKDDMIVLWYNDRIFTLSSILNSRQRKSSLSGAKVPELSVSEISVDLHNQLIIDINIRPADKTVETSYVLGSGMAGELLVTTEYGFITVKQSKSHEDVKKLPNDTNSSSRLDRRLLERGELQIDGVDRMLDSMMGIEATGMMAARKVGFRD